MPIQLDLSSRQQATIATALTMLSGLVILMIVLALGWMLISFVSFFSGVFLPLAVAFVIALVLKPFYAAIQARIGKRPALSVLIVYAAILLPLILLCWFFGRLAVEQITDMIGELPETARKVHQNMLAHWPKIQELWLKYEMTTRVEEFWQTRGDAMTRGLTAAFQSAVAAGASVFRAVAGSLGWFVVPIYLGFFLMAPSMRVDRLTEHMPFLKEATRKDVVYLIDEFVNIVVAFFRGQLLVALAQGVLFAIGFMLVGLQYGFVIGLLLGFLNIIPYLGSMIGLAIALPLAFFQDGGGAVTLGLVVLVFAVVQVIEGYVLTPKIMGDRTGLHPLAIMVALFFWGTVFGGIMGMIMAIPLTAFLVVFWRLAKEKYIAEIV